MKSRKSSKKKAEAISVDPENIDFDTFNSPEMLKYMDDELKQFVQQQGKSNAVANEAAVAKEDPTSGSGQDRRVSIQTLEVPSVALQLSGEKEGTCEGSESLTTFHKILCGLCLTKVQLYLDFTGPFLKVVN